jgi:hypothetical protein
MDSKAAIRLGKGSLRERVNALGNKACRASTANSVEQIRSVNWERKDLRVNPIFCCHGSSHFLQRFQKYLTKSTGYSDYFILSSRHCTTLLEQLKRIHQQTVETSDGQTLTGLTEMTPAQKSLFAALDLTPPTPSDLAKPVL